ncbi:hypothetical protein JYU34_006445 [Plutella xylostella]|uniref:FP protein C-terminal domain-containing protein n=1 Tax=Plutella xylostella TaxID=51655 RepID=A0ABQ7QS39_PLUXY|nr:hypothetical protein JYU34_006445 [Plutella xylostella]
MPLNRTPPSIPTLSNTDCISENLCQSDPNLSLTSDHSVLSEQITQRIKRKRSTKQYDTTSDNLTGFKNEIKDFIKDLISNQNARLDRFENHIMEIKSQYTKIEDSNSSIEKSMNHMSDQLTSLENNISALEKERSNMVSQISLIEEKMENFERNLLKTSIEIRNVPKLSQGARETKEQLYALARSLSTILNVELKGSDIRDVMRYPSKKEAKSSTISIEFSNTLLKTRILQASKEYNKRNPSDKLNSSLLGLNSDKVPIYVAEKLSANSNRLFYMARSFTKSNNYLFCWTSEGRILIKKDTNSTYIVVKSESQLETIVKPNTA